MTKRWLLLVALVGACEEVGTSLSGEVIDSKNGKPISGAVVSCAQPGFIPAVVVGTDERGKFNLVGCPRGRVDVDVSAKQYSATTVSALAHAEGLIVRLTEGVGWRTGGVGAGLRLDGEGMMIEVVQGGPLAKARVVDGTRLLAVDGAPVTSDLDAVANRLRGDVGSRVVLVVQEPSESEPRTVSVTREEIVDD